MNGVRHLFMLLAIAYGALAILWISDDKWVWSVVSIAGSYVCYMLAEHWRDRS